MNIGLVAHDSKKKLMQNFCIAYRGILAKNQLFATGTTGRLIEEVANLQIHKYLAGHLGGSQQLGAQIEHNEIDLVIFLRDPLKPKSHEPDVNSIVRLCDEHNIPLATNLATAELLIKSLDKQINALSLEDEWVKNPNEEAIKNLTFKREFVNLALGYKLAKEEEYKKEHELAVLNSKLEELKESQKTPEDRIKEIEDQIAALQ